MQSYEKYLRLWVSGGKENKKRQIILPKSIKCNWKRRNQIKKKDSQFQQFESAVFMLLDELSHIAIKQSEKRLP